MNNAEGKIFEDAGSDIHSFMAELYPICRSISGEGLRETLRRIEKHIPLGIHEVPTGTKVFDWIVPKEWNIRDAYVKNSRGEKVIDFQRSNLHVVNYSVPVRKKVSLRELKEHLFTLPDQPNIVPYVTSYYKEQWGFCATQVQSDGLPEGQYEVMIDADLKEGSITYGEFFIPGERAEEVLFSTYVCHPSLCNDNLSGAALCTFLAKFLKSKKLKFSYRFLFIPETIGALTWLSKNENVIPRIKGGLVVTCVGDPGRSTYKRSRRGNTLIDKAVEKVLADSGGAYEVIDFFPSGSDERQYCSPGFNLPVGSLMRTPYGRFREYHTSADDLRFVRRESLEDSFKKYCETVFIIENESMYQNLFSKGEPQLGKRGLYKLAGEPKGREAGELAMLWVLNLSDGRNSLLDIAIRSGLHFRAITDAAAKLVQAGLLKSVDIIER